MLSTHIRPLAAVMAALSLCAAPAWADPTTPTPPPKDPPIGGGYRLPPRPPTPCMDEQEPGPVVDCAHHHPPPCCCVAYDAPLRCPDRWRDIEDSKARAIWP